MNTITTLSPAKLNLFLHITGKRNDGYHNLQTVFRLLDWGDNLTFVVSPNIIKQENNPVRLHCKEQLTTNPTDNLIIKAANALIKTYQRSRPTKQLPIIDIYLDKQIPTGAGLGGGSSNAATTLITLNQLWQLQLNKQQLMDIGVTLGADVPIFIYGQDAIAEGIGELLTPIHLPQQSYLLLTPSAHIATSDLFAHPQLCRNKPTLNMADIHTQSIKYLNILHPPFVNVFEPVVADLNTEVNNALTYLRQLEAQTKTTARMTGSGSCVFLPLPNDMITQTHTNKTHEKMIANWLTNAPCHGYVVNSQANKSKTTD